MTEKTPKEPVRHFSIGLDRENDDRIAAEAKALGISKSAAIRVALRRFFSQFGGLLG